MSTHRPTHRRGETEHQSRRTRTYRTAVDLPAETRTSVVGMLNATLADATDLMTQAKVAHWNVKGMHFYQLHQLFDEIAETLEEHVDIIAERTTALGGEATGTVRDAAANTRIPEIPPDATTGPEYVEALVERVGIHANNLRRDIEVAVEYDDEDTADMYTELSREVDKQLYFLEAHLQAVDPDAIPDSPGASTGGQGSAQAQQSMQGQRSMENQQSTQGGRPSQYRQGSQRGGGANQWQGQSDSSQYGGGQIRSGGRTGSESQMRSDGRTGSTSQTQRNTQFHQRASDRGQRSYGRGSGY